MATNATINVTANTSAAERAVEALFKKDYNLNVNVKGGQPLGRITGDLTEFNKSMEAANARVIAFGASASVVMGIQKAFHALIDSTIEVQKAFNQIQVVINANDKEMNKFGASLFNVAKQTGQSFETVAEAATLLSRQGLGMEETLKRTNDALILSRITGMDAAKSVQALTAAINSFTNQAVTATEVVNKFATVDTQFAIGAKDLPEAIGRVGSSAAQAGVSLDQLIALVTAAQVATARGGAVIGNSFKTIFTRLDRPKTQDLLESLGISTTDASGKVKGTIELLQDLARVYDTLSRPQQAQVAEKVGGVFQINILKATLADLNKEYSVYNRALQVSAGATDDAYKRNEALNQTYAAQLNALKLNATQFAASTGDKLFGPALSRLVGAGNTVLGAVNEADANSYGAKLANGILSGLGQFLAGPGLGLIGGVLIKLFADFSKYIGVGAKELLGLNTAAKEHVKANELQQRTPIKTNTSTFQSSKQIKL
jgi:TP901 family phage tail tape measure protein